MIQLTPIEKVKADYTKSLATLGKDSSVYAIVKDAMEGVDNLYKLATMPSKDIREVLKKEIGHKVPNHFLDNARIVKKIEDDEIESITLVWYDVLEINATYVVYTPEHRSGENLIKTYQLKI
jgi:hypothetical protein